MSDCHFQHFHVCIGVAMKRLTKGSWDAPRPQLGCCQLIQQRLELLVVVLVNEGDADVTSLGQFSSTSQAGKAASYNHNVRFRTVTTHCGPPGELADSAAVSRPSFWWQQMRSAERSNSKFDQESSRQETQGRPGNVAQVSFGPVRRLHFVARA